MRDSPTANFGFNDLPLTGWYPGHMLSAEREMQRIRKVVDVVVEMVDARAPASSRNRSFTDLLKGKPFYLIAAKADLADPDSSRRWQAEFKQMGLMRAFIDARSRKQTRRVVADWRRLAHRIDTQRTGNYAARRPLRVMVAGIPNVGKSTLANTLAARRRAGVGPKPGVTRQLQWIALSGNIEILDTPGVIWPEIHDKIHELKLALLGTIPDEQVGIELLAEFLWTLLHSQVAGVNWELYNCKECPQTPNEFIEAVAVRRGLFRAGGEVDTMRAAEAVVKDFRAGRLGRVTIDVP